MGERAIFYGKYMVIRATKNDTCKLSTLYTLSTIASINLKLVNNIATLLHYTKIRPLYFHEMYN